MTTIPLASLLQEQYIINILRVHSLTCNILKRTKDMKRIWSQNDIVYCTTKISIIIYDPKKFNKLLIFNSYLLWWIGENLRGTVVWISPDTSFLGLSKFCWNSPENPIVFTCVDTLPCIGTLNTLCG